MAPPDEQDQPVVLPGPDEPVSYAKHVRTFFRPLDRDSMERSFDLWSYDDVKANAQPILDRVSEGTMPCDGAWPADRVEALKRWVDTGLSA
jgi:hypothetical protein